MTGHFLAPRRFRRALCLVALVGLAGAAALAQVTQPPEMPIEIIPVRATTSGFVIGFVDDEQPGLHSWLGIPYAQPPVGDLRFRPPRPAVPDRAPIDAIFEPPSCLQAPYPEGGFYFQPLVEASEDCLYLNVWTAAETSNDRLPVMVWIHGGALTRGSGSLPVYDGSALAQKGVVVVTINYRLGAFGYLAHRALSAESEHGVSGNYGVLDQVLALEWVRDNIATFGGDPDRVTIFGESAGAWSVNVLQASPLARGLFHRVIGQSGGMFDGLPELRSPGDDSAEANGAEFARRLGVEGDDAATRLRELDAEAILAEASKPGAFATRPNVDGRVLPKQPMEIYRLGEQADVPVLVGSNRDEATSLMGRMLPSTKQAVEFLVRSQFPEVEGAFFDTYPVSGDAEARRAFIDAFSDRVFAWHMKTWAELSATVSSPAWLYFFSHAPPHPEREIYGAYHAAEIAYVFDNLDKLDFEYAEEDHRLAEAMSDIWVAFAAHGDPNPPDAALPAWPAWEKGERHHVEFGSSVEPGSRLHERRMEMWDRYFGLAGSPQP